MKISVAMAFNESTEPDFIKNALSQDRAHEMSKISVGQTYTMGIICSFPTPIGIGLTNLPSSHVSSHIPAALQD